MHIYKQLNNERWQLRCMTTAPDAHPRLAKAVMWRVRMRLLQKMLTRCFHASTDLLPK